MSLLKIYEKSDVYAIGRMFYTILLPPEVDRTFQKTIERNPFYTAQDIPDLPLQLSRGLKILFKSLVGSNVSERLDEQTAKLLYVHNDNTSVFQVHYILYIMLRVIHISFFLAVLGFYCLHRKQEN